jgi:hypothetical protein
MKEKTAEKSLRRMSQKEQLAWEAKNRRKLLAKLNPNAKALAEREFAKLGLYQ